ncbi:MAG TPA: hypothetical protein VF590_25560 [Isosphaeraceae bacterium]|jgi:hypothetical protein
MRFSRRLRPSVESLEAKALLSAVRPALPAAAEVRVDPSLTRPLRVLSGTIRGRYQVEPGDPRIPDLPPVYRLSAQGRASPLGRVQADGALFVGGFKPDAAPDNGTLTLRTPRGSVTLQVEGPIRGTPPGQPIPLRAYVREGTGRFADLRGLGEGTLRLGPEVACQALGCPDPGTVSLRLTLYTPRR